MTSLAIPTLLALIAFVGWGVVSRENERILVLWTGLAERSGLEYRVHATGPKHRLEGSLARFPTTAADEEEAGFCVVLHGLPLPDLRVERQNLGRTMAQSVSGHTDVQLADPPVDRALLLEGDPAALLALLDAPMREAWCASDLRLEVRDGCARLSSAMLADRAEVLDAAAAIARCARRGITAGLTRRLDDPVPTVRRQALSILLASDDADTAARHALRSADSTIRVRAMKHLGMGGTHLEIALDAGADDLARLEAVQAMLDDERVVGDAVVAVLSNGGPRALAGIMALVRRERLHEHVPAVAALLAQSRSTSVKVEALRVIGELAGREFLPVVRSIARSTNRAVRRAAEAATAALTERHGIAPGGLSLAAAEGGQLSEVEPADAGGMSLPSGARRGRTLQGE